MHTSEQTCARAHSRRMHAQTHPEVHLSQQLRGFIVQPSTNRNEYPINAHQAHTHTHTHTHPHPHPHPHPPTHTHTHIGCGVAMLCWAAQLSIHRRTHPQSARTNTTHPPTFANTCMASLFWAAQHSSANTDTNTHKVHEQKPHIHPPLPTLAWLRCSGRHSTAQQTQTQTPTQRTNKNHTATHLCQHLCDFVVLGGAALSIQGRYVEFAADEAGGPGGGDGQRSGLRG